MRVGEPASVESGVVGSMRSGVLEQKFLLTGQDGSPNNYVLNIGRAGGGGWSAPRHRHNFDQIRYVLRGNYPIAKGKAMPEGTVGYFPEGAYYGPQDRPEGLETMVCQFGGASGAGFLSVAQREAANDVLKRKGEFKDGVFTFYDEKGQKHNQDGFEACYEQAMGRKLVYPKPRYDDIILMDPAHYEWLPGESPGVSIKPMGAFTERNTQLGFVRVRAGATLAAGMQSSIELLFLSEGRVSVSGHEFGSRSAFEFLAHEGPVLMQAISDALFLRIVLPRF